MTEDEEKVIDEAIAEVQQPEYTEEEQKARMEMFEGIFKHAIRNRLSDIKKYLKENKMTVDEAIQEVHEKKSHLTNSNRATLLEVKPEYLRKWLNE